MSEDTDEGVNTSDGSACDVEGDLSIPYDFGEQLAMIDGVPPGGESTAEDRSEQDKKAQKVYKNLNGQHCFILEQGSTIQHLTIYRDSVKTSNKPKNEANGFTYQRPGAGPHNALESQASNTSTEDVTVPFAAIEYLPSSPKTSETEVRTYEEFFHAPTEGVLQKLPFTRDNRYETYTETRLAPSASNQAVNGANTFQLCYDRYMNPFPGVYCHRYDVEQHYVKTRLYKEYRKAGRTTTAPLNLEDLFTYDYGEWHVPVTSVLVVGESGKTALIKNILHSYAIGVTAVRAFPSSSSLLFKISLKSSIMSQLNPYSRRIERMKLLLIIDDYDPQNSKEEHKLKKLLSREHEVYTIGATSVSILLTTEPFLSNEILGQFHSRVQVGKLANDEAFEFVTKFTKEGDSEDVFQNIKDITKNFEREISPLVLLSILITLQDDKNLDRRGIIERCKYMIAWRCQKKAQSRGFNLITKSLRLQRLPPFHEKRLHELKSRYCEEAEGILRDSGIDVSNS